MRTKEFRIEDYLGSDEEIAAYLSAALAENDPVFFNVALGDVARARGMTQIAERAGVGRESLYKSLSAEGNPQFGTIMDVLGALGLKLVVSPGA